MISSALVCGFMVSEQLASRLFREYGDKKILRGVLTIYQTVRRQVRADHSLDTGPFIMFSVFTNIYNKKTKGPSLMDFFTATGKLKKFFFFDN